MTMTCDETMFYHRVLASKRKPSGKKSFLPDLHLMDLLMTVVAFGAYYLLVGGEDMPTQLAQAGFAAFIFLMLIRQLNGRKRKDKEINSEAVDRRRAKANLEISRREGETCEVRFGEDAFEVEYPGIVTEYRYEGIRRIKETPEYYMIIWNSTEAIPVAKNGFEEGAEEAWKTFMIERSGKEIEAL